METRESVNEPVISTGPECESCGERKRSVCERPNAYANDVGNDPTAVHTVCDECDYQNRMDI